MSYSTPSPIVLEASDVPLPVGQFPVTFMRGVVIDCPSCPLVDDPAECPLCAGERTARVQVEYKASRRVLDFAGEDLVAVVYLPTAGVGPEIHILND